LKFKWKKVTTTKVSKHQYLFIHVPNVQKMLLIKYSNNFHIFYTIYMYSIMSGTYFVQLHQRQLCMPTTNSNNYIIENGNQTFHIEDLFTFQ
jgi:hypothetical protein